MTFHDDGHTVALTLTNDDVEWQIICPFEGQSFPGFDDAPMCRRQEESGDPGAGHYRRDDCALIEHFDTGWGYIAESFAVPDGNPFTVTTLPFRVMWRVERDVRIMWTDRGEIWLTPVTATPKPAGAITDYPVAAHDRPCTSTRDCAGITKGQRYEDVAIPPDGRGNEDPHWEHRSTCEECATAEGRAFPEVTP